MKDAENTPNVVKVCNKPGLFDELEGLQKRLVLSTVLNKRNKFIMNLVLHVCVHIIHFIYTTAIYCFSEYGPACNGSA